jgi:hypothetical protein
VVLLVVVWRASRPVAYRRVRRDLLLPVPRVLLENREQACAHTQILIGVQVGQRHPNRPSGIGKSAAVEQHNAVVCCEAEHGIDGLVPVGEPIGELLAVAPPRPSHQVDLGVVAGAKRIRGQLPLHSRVEVDEPTVDDGAGAQLVRLVEIHEREHREQRHLHLLRQRQTRGVVQCDLTTVGHHAIDERDLGGVGADGLVSAIELLELVGIHLPQATIDDVVLVNRDHTKTPSRRAEIFRERVHRDRVRRNDIHQGHELGNEGSVDIVGDDDELRIVFAYHGRDPRQGRGCEHHRRRVRRIHDEHRAHAGVGELVDLGVGKLPRRVIVLINCARTQRDDFEPVAFQPRQLEIRRELRDHQRDAITRSQQKVVGERIEDVADRRGSPLDREEIPDAVGWLALAQLVGEVLAQDPLRVHANAIRTGVVIADDAVGQLVYELVGIEAQRHAVSERFGK